MHEKNFFFGKMNLGFWNFYTFYNKNRMFTSSVSTVGDELGYPTVVLGQQLRSLGHSVSTLDLQPLESFDKIFFWDYPTVFNKYFRQLVRSRHPETHLILVESPVVRPDNYDPRKHVPFKTVMTWQQDLYRSNPAKYRLYHLQNKHRPGCFSTRPFAQRKLCTLINSFMCSNRQRELYSERVKTIRWFEANAPSDFDLIGTEWDKPLFPPALAFLNLPLRFAYRRIRWCGKIKVNRFPSFIGPNRKSKHLTLHDYRFCIAYENCVEPYYISEKIFDCFYAGCVPVYLGAPNITDAIPPNTFIDRRNFKTCRDLHSYLSSITESQFNDYLSAINSFIHSPQITPFIAETFAKTFIDTYVQPGCKPREGAGQNSSPGW